MKKKPASKARKKVSSKVVKPTAAQIRLRPLTSRLDLDNIILDEVTGVDSSGNPTSEQVYVYNEYTGDPPAPQGPGYEMQPGDTLLCGEPAPSGNDLTNVTVVDQTMGSGTPTDPYTVVMEYSDPATGNDPPFVEANMEYFDDYEEYYDEEDDTPVYEGSDCDSGIGIRG